MIQSFSLLEWIQIPQRTPDIPYSHTSTSGSPYWTVVCVDHSGDFYNPNYRDFSIVRILKESHWEPRHSTHPTLFDEDKDKQEEHKIFDSRQSRFNTYLTPAGLQLTSHPREQAIPSPTRQMQVVQTLPTTESAAQSILEAD